MAKFGSDSKFFVKIFFFIPLLTILNYQNDLELLFWEISDFDVLHHQFNQDLTLCHNNQYMFLPSMVI